MKNFLLTAVFLATVFLANGCSLVLPKKIVNFPKGCIGYTNGTVVKVENIREVIKFKGPMIDPEIKKSGTFTIKTDQDEIYTTDYETLFDVNETSDTARNRMECSPASVGHRVTIYIDEGKVVGMCQISNLYLEKKSPKK